MFYSVGLGLSPALCQSNCYSIFVILSPTPAISFEFYIQGQNVILNFMLMPKINLNLQITFISFNRTCLKNWQPVIFFNSIAGTQSSYLTAGQFSQLSVFLPSLSGNICSTLKIAKFPAELCQIHNCLGEHYDQPPYSTTNTTTTLYVQQPFKSLDKDCAAIRQARDLKFFVMLI